MLSYHKKLLTVIECSLNTSGDIVKLSCVVLCNIYKQETRQTVKHTLKPVRC